jgi:phosphatidylglycerophosphate synthase
MLTIFGDIPLWFTLLILFRDAVIFFAGIYIKTKTGIILPSLMSGKAAVSFLTLTLVFAVLQYSWMNATFEYLLWFTIGLLAYSFLEYAQRFFQTLREHKK